MKRLLLPVLGAAALALAACGSDGGAASSPPPPSGAGAVAAPVSVADVAGVGKVLVDAAGKALYTPDQEASGSVLCVDACVAIWAPVAAGDATPVVAGGPTLGVVTRPDGVKQLAVGGRPLYTFAEDSAGKVTGDGATDSFGSQGFNWHVVMSDGTISSGPTATTPAQGGGGYGGY